MNWKVFLQAIGAALVGGAASGAATYIGVAGPHTGTGIGMAAAAGALTTVAGLLLKSPIGPRQ